MIKDVEQRSLYQMVPPVSVTLEVFTTVVTLLWGSVQMIVLVLELLTTNRQQPHPHPHHYHPLYLFPCPVWQLIFLPVFVLMEVVTIIACHLQNHFHGCS